jgi:hypothetical protein
LIDGSGDLDKDEFRRFLATKPERSAIEWAAREAVRLGKATKWELRDAAQDDRTPAAAVEAALFSWGGARYRRGNGHDDPPEVKTVDLVCASDIPIKSTDWLGKVIWRAAR